MSLRLRSKVSPAAMRIIREAFEELERTVAPIDAKEFENSTLHKVQRAALEIENLLGARRSLRNMRRIMPFFTGLQHYSESIEVLCNGTPFLPWIWAPIKLILRVSFLALFVRALLTRCEDRLLPTTLTPLIRLSDTIPASASHSLDLEC
jgi:hypothetical protein